MNVVDLDLARFRGMSDGEIETWLRSVAMDGRISHGAVRLAASAALEIRRGKIKPTLDDLAVSEGVTARTIAARLKELPAPRIPARAPGAPRPRSIPMIIEADQDALLQVMVDLGMTRAEIESNRRRHGCLFLIPAELMSA